MRPSHVQSKQPHLPKTSFLEIWPYMSEKKNLPKWTAWMEAWWLPFLISWGIWVNPLALSIDPCFMGVGGMGGSPSIRRCTRHLMPGILDRMACGVALALAIGGGAVCRRPAPGGKKTALFWGVLDVHKTSQIPSKMALGRGRFGARGGSPRNQNTRGKLVF